MNSAKRSIKAKLKHSSSPKTSLNKSNHEIKERDAGFASNADLLDGDDR
ncbi:MAG: hypothetical protein Tsb0014_11730 [Pleurocapsa sp.]